MNVPYLAAVLFMLALVAMGLVTPLLAFAGNPLAPILYHDVFAPTCHQKISRSLCVFQSQAGYYVADCTLQLGKYVEDSRSETGVINEKGELGYKMPYCSRDFAIYAALLIGLAVYPFVRNLGGKVPPAGIFFILALVPLGLDGTIQLVSDLGFVLPLIGSYESTNAMRLFTGSLAGFAAAFYVVPMLNSIFGSLANRQPAMKKKARKNQ